MEKGKNKGIIITIVSIVLIALIAISIIEGKNIIDRNNQKEDNKIIYSSSSNKEYENNNKIQQEDKNTINKSGNLINYIEVEMPNLVGKSYMNIYYDYDLKAEIINQLMEKDLDGTTFNLNTIKYLNDGTIFLNGSYTIEGYGYEVERQNPEAGTKIKIINDGEGNVSLENDVYLYIKGGGETRTRDIDKDKRNASKKDSSSNSTNYNYSTNSNNSNNSSSFDYFSSDTDNAKKERQFIHTAISGCLIVNTNGAEVTYKNKCDYCDYMSPSRNNINHSSGTYSTSFTCPKCRKINSVKIETTSR